MLAFRGSFDYREWDKVLVIYDIKFLSTDNI
jgi:hypothetical protein